MKKKKKKKMHYISVIWGIIMLLLVLGLTIIAIIYKKETKEYKAFESALEEKTREYIETNGLYPNDNVTYSVEELLEKKVVETNIVKDKKCEGYVEIENNNQSFTYQAYVKCGTYKTLGYKKSDDLKSDND